MVQIGEACVEGILPDPESPSLLILYERINYQSKLMPNSKCFVKGCGHMESKEMLFSRCCNSQSEPMRCTHR